MTVFRLPFRWERLQRTLNGEFDAEEFARLDAIVSYITSQRASVVLDPHNYARYAGQVVGTAIDAGAFADFWARLAHTYADNPRVVFGLMNEPSQMPTEIWLEDANQAIQAIRATGAANLILVPGNGWTGAWTWEQDWYGTPNAVAMLQVQDPLHNLAFEVHQYLDDNVPAATPRQRPAPRRVSARRLVRSGSRRSSTGRAPTGCAASWASSACPPTRSAWPRWM